MDIQSYSMRLSGMRVIHQRSHRRVTALAIDNGKDPAALMSHGYKKFHHLPTITKVAKKHRKKKKKTRRSSPLETMVVQDIQLSIFSYLDLSSLRSVMGTSRSLRQVLLTEDARFLWMDWCHRTWPSLKNTKLTQLVDETNLPTMSISRGMPINVPLLLAMAPSQSQPLHVDSSQFLMASLQEDEEDLKSFEKDGKELIQFVGGVGRGDRCVRTTHPLPRPTRKESHHHESTSIWHPWSHKKNSSHHLKPFVSPFCGANNKVHVTPRFVSYFEISILEEAPKPQDDDDELLFRPPDGRPPKSACVAIGLATEQFRLRSSMPGWDMTSFGYHGDDGAIFHGNGDSIGSFGPAYGPGDTVGCGVDHVSQSIFFTLNGKFLGNAWTGLSECTEADLYPVVGVDSNAPIVCNFGEHPFAFDLSFMMRVRQHHHFVKDYYHYKR